jgi:hypothetical protein
VVPVGGLVAGAGNALLLNEGFDQRRCAAKSSCCEFMSYRNPTLEQLPKSIRVGI